MKRELCETCRQIAACPTRDWDAPNLEVVVQVRERWEQINLQLTCEICATGWWYVNDLRTGAVHWTMRRD